MPLPYVDFAHWLVFMVLPRLFWWPALGAQGWEELVGAFPGACCAVRVVAPEASGMLQQG